MPLVDVSMPLRAGMPSFPGDPVLRVAPWRSMATGSPYNVSELTLGTHAGTHVDPPIHFVEGGATVDQIELTRLNGPCQVVEVGEGVRSIGPGELSGVRPGTARLLLKSSNSARWAADADFFADYVALSPEAADHLVELGVGLVGIDSLSIESDPTGTFPVHRTLLGTGSLILEGLQLARVPAGPSELLCLPMRLVGGDGGPCRAAVRVAERP